MATDAPLLLRCTRCDQPRDFDREQEHVVRCADCGKRHSTDNLFVDVGATPMSDPGLLLRSTRRIADAVERVAARIGLIRPPHGDYTAAQGRRDGSDPDDPMDTSNPETMPPNAGPDSGDRSESGGN